MSGESLEQIVQAINCLGGDAKEAFIWYMAAWIGVTLIQYVVPAAVFVAIVAMILRIVMRIVVGVSACYHLVADAGVRTVSNGYDFRPADFNKLHEFIQEARRCGGITFDD